MTSKIIVNTIEADTGISSVTFASNINLQNDSSVLVSSSGIRLGTGSTIAAPSANEITLSTNSAERLRINSAGQMILGTATNLGSVPPKLTIVNNTNSSTFSQCQLLRLNGPSGVGERGGIGFHYAQSLDYGEKPSSFIGVETVAAGGAQQTDLLFATRPNTTDSEPTERLRITSAGLVGIATAVPSYRLDIGDGVTDPANGNQLRVNAAGDYIFALQKQSNASFSIRNNSTGIVHLNTQNSKILSFGVSSGNASGSIEDDVRIDSNGHLTILDGNLVVANGHGIDFSATGNGSGTMSSELLDDYEEGTFTPSWGDSNSSYSSPSPSYASQTGHYTKVGNTVYFDFELATSNWNGSGSTMWVHGLPYAARNSGGYQQAISGSFCIQGVDGANAINTLTGQMQPGVSLIQLYYQTATSGNNYNTFSTASVAETTNLSIRFNGFYFIS